MPAARGGADAIADPDGPAHGCDVCAAREPTEASATPAFGCDVCGLSLPAENAELHAGRHRAQDERLDAISGAVRELSGIVRDRRS